MNNVSTLGLRAWGFNIICTAMGKYTLVSATATRKPHIGLMVQAWYKQDPENVLEVPYRLTVFNSWPPTTLEAEAIEYPLNGTYKYPNGKRVNTLHLFCPKTKEGLFYKGYSPAEQIAERMKNLTVVGKS